MKENEYGSGKRRKLSVPEGYLEGEVESKFEEESDKCS